MEVFSLVVAFIVVLTVFKGVRIVPQQSAWVIERLGKFRTVLNPGLNVIIPYVDSVAYKHNLKETAIDIPSQTTITRDNVSLRIDGLLYLKIIDPKAASYGVSDPAFAISQLAQTTMRSELGKIEMDRTFEERETLNLNIVRSINEAANPWGIQCMRYEIKDITPPDNVRKAMELQVAAERQKRAEILDSEGKKQAQINVAEGGKQEVVLESEAAYTDQVNRARGEAEAILMVADATAKGIEMVGAAIMKTGGSEAMNLRVAEQYVSAFQNLAKTNNTILLPADTGNAGSMVAQALGVFETIRKSTGAPSQTPNLPRK
ncbi:MAG: paraslipin [Nitrospinota bacterium]|nr:paraslipin [Nitrospinota bacterium]